MTNKSKTLIVGAGIAGLLAASELQKAGHSVTLIDKGRGVGGRMASRRLSADGNARADHGAQFFTVRDPIFQRWVSGWQAAGVILEWCRGFSGNDGHPRYVGKGGMTAVPKQLAADLDVRTRTKVIAISQKDSVWQAATENAETFTAENLILTPPVPQSLALLDAGRVSLPAEARQSLEKITYHPCFAVMASLAAPSSIPPAGGVQVRGEIIDWIGDNQQKGISAEPTVTIHASPQFTTQHLDADRPTVGRMLLDAAEQAGFLRTADVVDTHVHRWMFAQPITCYPERCLKTAVNGLSIVFAGDAFKHARVEGAALSGLTAAKASLGSE